MGVPLWALGHQGDNIRAIISVLFAGSSDAPQTPGPVLSEEIQPRADKLIRAFKTWCEDPSDDGVLPGHFFPQWALPLMGQALGASPYPIRKILNQGFRLERSAPLAADQPLALTAQLSDLDEQPHRARLTNSITCGPVGGEIALKAEVYSVVPLGGPRPESLPKAKQAEPNFTVLKSWRAGRFEGARYSCLSGDINPLHWFPPAAWAAGMRAPILHGFAAGSVVIAHLDRVAGGPVPGVDMRFIKPMVLPARLTLELDESTGALRVVDARNRPCVVGSVRMP